eukprot:GILK01008571.1.p1 GENE.GILK01008571.1~~GILK01008571.1.p1  ORF type:complete len:563 (+),score=55.31 GILK01008571.1:106-1794(+)
MASSTVPSAESSPKVLSGCPCPHLQSFKQQGGLRDFSVAQKFLIKQRDGLGKKRLLASSCIGCKAATDYHDESFGAKLFVCVQCVFVGCWQVGGGHIKQHFKDKNHCLAIETSRGEVYCSHCQDFVYDQDFDRNTQEVFDNHQQVKAKKRKIAEEQCGPRVEFVTSTSAVWQADGTSKTVLEHLKCPSADKPKFIGMRGLNNMGNTCFMNCILQALVHNPFLRNFFLTEQHIQSQCLVVKGTRPPQSPASSKLTDAMDVTCNNGNGNGKETACLGCEMDSLLSHMYSGNGQPYTPYSFLYSMWQYADHLAGYKMQDAHEFFISTLNGLHQHTCEDPALRDCRCIVHKIFSGLLRSDVRCTQCGHTSTAYDPFLDISLDIKDGTTESPNSKPVTLEQCLLRFTGEERLESFRCSSCAVEKSAVKQLSMQKLPLVFCFHLKRFEHNLNNKKVLTRTKVEDFVKFPAHSLDMSPFLAHRNVKDPTAAGNGSLHPQHYDLFAVVNHYGSIDHGHYTCYIVQGESNWFKCDDAWITHVDASEVLESEGYLLFYVKRDLLYASSVTTS